MATKSTTTTTKKTTTTRAKKPVEPKVEETPVVNNNDALIAQLMEQIKLQNEKMAELQAQIDNNKTQQVIVASTPQNEYATKKIKLVNMMHNPLNLSTEPFGRGKVVSFEKYGDTRLVKFDDLCEIYSTHPNAIEKGLCYIADTKAVELLGITEEYENVISPDVMELVPTLREDYLVDLFIGMDRSMQDSLALEMAKRINASRKIDFNGLQRIKEEIGIDIQAIAADLKDLERKPSDE